jgi:iron complex outermembrane receptor protein
MVWRKTSLQSSELHARFQRAAGTIERRCFRCAVLLLSAVLAAAMAHATEGDDSIDFNIPRQRADLALILFAEQADLTLIVPFEEVSETTANSLIGRYSVEEGASVLLAGTGLKPTFSEQLVLAIAAERASDQAPIPAGDDMKKSKRGVRMGTILASILAATGASGQDADTGSDQEIEEIVVTGTRLTNRAFSGVAPVQVINPEVARLSGDFTAADIVRSSALATGSFQLNQQLGAVSPGGNVGVGGGGVNGISLRGLGTQRSLVVLDGRRLAPAGVRGQVSAVDLNVLPSSVLERIEIVKDGSSSIYGADAIAGVVNGVTKKNYDGGSVQANANVPVDSGGERIFVSADFGKTFDRGWIAMAAEYSDERAVKNHQRSFLRCSEDVVFYPDTGERADVVLDDGSFMCRNHNPNGAFFSADWFAGTFQPDPNGDHIGAPGDEFTRPFIPAWVRVGNFSLGDTEQVRESYSLRNEDSVAYQDADAISPLTRFTLFFSGEYRIGERASLYGNVLANRRESDFDSWMFLFQDMSGDHPNNTVSAGLQAASGGNSSGAIQYQLVRPFNSAQEVDYHNAVLGLRGEFSETFLSGWSWDAFVSVGRSSGKYSQDFMYEDRLNAISLGTTPCDASFLIPELSPASLCDGIDIPVLETRFLVDQEWTEQELAFLTGRDAGKTTYDQITTEASMAGPLFDLPAGTVEGVVGVSYREDEIDDRPGPNGEAGNLHLFSSARRTAGSENVREIFAEVGVPIFSGKPVAENVSAVGSVRYTSYDISGSETTYKLGLNWGFTPSVALRGSYGTSFRGPNLFELFLADQTSFQFLADPCQEYANATDPNVAANCASLGIPDDYRPLVFDTEVSQGGAILPDGTTTIRPETSDSWSAGLLLTPAETGLAVAVEYFEIDVKDEIDSLGAQQIVNACYSDVDFPDNAFCALIARNGSGGSNPFLLTLVNDRFRNIDSQMNRGVDFLLSYSSDIGGFGVQAALQGTRQLEDKLVRIIDGEPDEEDFLEDPNEPKYSGSMDVIVSKNDWTFYYGLNYLGSSGLTKEYGGDTFNFFGAYNGEELREKLESGSAVYHHVSVSKGFGDGLSASLGVRNVLDEEPPIVSVDWKFDGLRTGTAAQNSWDVLGRRVFLTVTKTFE